MPQNLVCTGGLASRSRNGRGRSPQFLRIRAWREAQPSDINRVNVRAIRRRRCKPAPKITVYACNSYSSYAASPRVRGVRRTGRGRRVPIAPLIRARARELDVELRELSGEAEGDEVQFAPTQLCGENEEQKEQETDDSGIFLAEEFVPARSSTPPPSSPSSAAYSSSPQRTAGLARAPTARTYPIAASPSRHGRNARTFLYAPSLPCLALLDALWNRSLVPTRLYPHTLPDNSLLYS
ncbi:hypothetical protein B0H14DRAFT_2614683 [Mycena olivaceomarginata]|nr:hypothetical protein B0H14DRAFT_2614683 [Mycena olivaceomarginata]